MKAQEVIAIIEKFAPPELAAFDYLGTLQGDETREVTKVGLTLDYCNQALQQAQAAGCDMLITHHGPTEIHFPLQGNLLEKVRFASNHQLVVYRCHLNLDFCQHGIIDTLCHLLEIPAKPMTTVYEGMKITGGVFLAENFPLTLEELLKKAEVLGGKSVRLAGKRRDHFSRIAITSGQGFHPAFFDQLQPEVYIAGEFEQEATKYAEDLGIQLVELGHHHSEQATLPIIAQRLTKLAGIPVVPIEVEDSVSVVTFDHIEQRRGIC